MVYRKRKTTFKRKVYKRQNVARKALYLAKKAQVQKELKWHDTAPAQVTVPADGLVYELSNVPQGATNNSRDGNVIYPSSINLRMIFRTIEAGSTSFRVIIYHWDNGASSQPTDVLDTASIVAFKSDRYRFNSRIIYDKSYTMTIGGVQERCIDIKRRIKGMIAYNEATVNPQKNGLFMIVIGGDAGSIVQYRSRLYFKDS